MRLKLNRTAALTLTGTAVLAALSQVGGAAPRSYIEGQDHENNNGEQVKADDLKGVTDPSKLSASDFKSGTKWTPAGWTRSNPQYVAKSSKTTVTVNQQPTIMQIGDLTFDIIATINKKDLKKGNLILISALQNKNENKQATGQTVPMYFNWSQFGTTDRNIYWRNEKIGEIVEKNLYDEDDFYLKIDPSFDLSKISNDPTIEFKNAPNTFMFNANGGWQFDYFKDVTFPMNYYLITSSNIYSWKFDDMHDIHLFREPTNINYWIMDSKNMAQSRYWGINMDIPADKTKIPTTVKRIIKIQATIPDAFKNSRELNKTWYIDCNQMSQKRFNVIDESNVITTDELPLNSDSNKRVTITMKQSNINPNTLLAQTPANTVSFNLNPDGSMYEAINIDTDIFKMNPNGMKDKILKSYYVNVQHKNDTEKIVNNTINYYKKKGFIPTSAWMAAYVDYNPDVLKKTFAVNVSDLDTDNPASTATNIHNANGSSFNAELYRTALVHYLDSKTGNNISNDSIMGTKNSTTDCKLNIPKGYILDTKSEKNVDGKQYKWSADKKSITYTFNEEQKLNDANPINIYITHGTHNTNDNSGKSTRTIQYTGLPDDLKPKDNVQTVLFKRSGVTDDVTGETTYGDWQPQAGNGHYTTVTSPSFTGYKPDQAVVPDTAATPNKNENVTVNYSRTNQNAKLTVHDDTANTDLNDYAENSTGLYQDQINFKNAPSAVEQELKDKGYNIVSDSFKGSPTYNADDSKNNFVIHVTHKIVPVTPDHPKTPTDVIPDTNQHYPTGVNTNDLNKDVQRSIFYKYEDNTQAEPTVVQKAHFDRTVKVDAVTQKIVDPGNWSTKDNYPEVATKSIDGYTSDKTKVGSAIPSMTTNQDQTIVYHANDEDAAITYIDDITGKVLKTDTQKAKYKQTIKFATDPNTQIQTYKDQGYVLVSSDWKNGSTYQTDPARNKFTVHLKHGTSTVTPDKPKKPTDIIPGTKQHYPTGVDTNDLNQSQQRQITYTYADSKKQASPTVTQKATFHRTATVDNVTGKTTYTDWTTSDQYPEVKSPTIEGYTPDKSNVSVTKPVLNAKQDVAVIYNPNPEQIDVIAQDNTGKQLSKSTLHGNYNTDYTATTPVIKGYHLIKMPTNTHGTYKTHNDSIIYIYAPDSNSVPEQTDGTPKPDKSSYPDDITPAKRSPKLPETGSTNLVSELKSDLINLAHLF